jgi:hypothetical protein
VSLPSWSILFDKRGYQSRQDDGGLTFRKYIFELFCHTTYIILFAVVQDTIPDYTFHVVKEFLPRAVLATVEFSLGRGQVHGFLDDGEIAVLSDPVISRWITAYSGTPSLTGSTGSLNRKLAPWDV